MLPVLSETATRYGIDPREMARASITGQTVHMQSPLVPAILLLVALAGVTLGDHHKKVLWRAAVVSLVMLGGRCSRRSGAVLTEPMSVAAPASAPPLG